MSYQVIPFEHFAGLDLRDAPDESTCIDVLNIDFDRLGRIRTRDGFAKFTAAPAAATFHSLAPFYKTDGTKQLLAAFGGASGAVNAYTTAGGIVAAQAAVSSTFASFARFAAPGSEHAYVAVSGSGAATVFRWDGAAWSTPVWTGTTPTGRHLAASADNRLVNARRTGTTAGDSPSTVRFSDAGVPTTWGANNFVEVSPGDGEEIMALVAWGNDVYAFKQTKFARFYGTSTDGSGLPVFNYRLVNSAGLSPSVGGNTAYRAICASPNGIYFANRRGIWLTNGGPAELVSRRVDPIFAGSPDSFGPSALNQAAVDQCAMVWHNERLWFAYPSGSSTTNDRILRYDPAADIWSLYDIPATALASFRVANTEDVMFGFSGIVSLGVPSSPAVSVSSTAGGTLATSQAYFYKVTALNATGETTPSSEVTVTPLTRTVRGSDNFDTLPPSASLNGRTAGTGGTWVTSGEATGDFLGRIASGGDPQRIVSDALAITAVGAGRMAILGVTAFADSAVQIDASSNGPQDAVHRSYGLILRWVDANNFVRFRTSGSNGVIEKYVAGVRTQIASSAGTGAGTVTLSASVTAAGVASMTLNGTVISSAVDSQLATGGVLASGRPGFWDYDSDPTGAAIRDYDNFSASSGDGIATSQTTVTWTAVTGATGYRVYRGTTAGGESAFFAPGNVVTFTDTGTAGTAGTPPVSNTATTTGFDIGRHSSSFTSDGGDGTTTGAAVNWRYRQGFWTPGSQDEKTDIREMVLEGTGVVTIQGSTDWGALNTGSSVTLGTSPAIAEGRARTAYRGRHFSYQFAGSTPASIQRAQAHARDHRGVGEK